MSLMKKTRAARTEPQPTTKRNTQSNPPPPTPCARQTMPLYEPFPVDALPEPVRSFVIDVSESMNVDASFVALPLLAVAAGMVGTARSVQPKRGWVQPCILWAVVVAEPSSNKTAPFVAVMKPVYAIQERLDTEFESAWRGYLEEKTRWEADEGKEKGKPPTPPTRRELTVTDSTIEALAELLAENPRGTILARDELAAWFGNFTRYRSGGSDAPNWLETFSAGHLKIKRKTGDRRRITVPKAAVSVTGTIQPGILANAMNGELREAGCPARFLFAMPPRRQRGWTDHEADTELERRWADIVARLIELCGGKEIIELDSGAKQLFSAFVNDNGADQFNAHGVETRAALGKLDGLALRLALVMYLLEWASDPCNGEPPNGPICAATMSNAITLVRWFGRESLRVHADMHEQAEARELRDTIEWIRAKGGEITARDMRRLRGAKRYPTTEAAEAELDALVSSGYGQWIDRKATEKGGRPTRVFRLVCFDETDETSKQAA